MRACSGGGERGEREVPHRHGAAALLVPALHHRPAEARQVPRRHAPQVPDQGELGAGTPAPASFAAWPFFRNVALRFCFLPAMRWKNQFDAAHSIALGFIGDYVENPFEASFHFPLSKSWLSVSRRAAISVVLPSRKRTDALCVSPERDVSKHAGQPSRESRARHVGTAAPSQMDFQLLPRTTLSPRFARVRFIGFAFIVKPQHSALNEFH